MKIKNIIRLTVLIIILSGCLNKKEKNINIANKKGYLKEYLKAEERAELNDIIRSGNVKKFEEFIDKHKEIVENYPIIVKIMKSKIEPKSEEESAIEIKSKFNEAIRCFMIRNRYDKETRQKVLTMRGNILLPNEEEKVKKVEVTPLMAIAYYVPKIIAKDLMHFTENGLIDVNEKTVNGKTALMIAARSKDENYVFEAMLELINAGAKVVERAKDGSTVLHIAALNGYKKVMELLLDRGAIVNEKTSAGFTAVYIAAEKGHKEIVELLLSKGASINVKKTDGWTALHIAAEKGRKDIVELLLNKGASIDVKTAKGYMALYWAARFGHKEIVEILLRAGAKINERAVDGSTALHSAAFIGCKEVVKLLLDKGAVVNEKTFDGYTALHIAVENGHAQIIDLLYRSLANVNVKDSFEATSIGLLYCLAIKKEEYRPLFISIINHELKILFRLLQKRVNNVSIELRQKLKKIDKKSLKEIESLKAITKVMECDSLIRNEIFKNVVEVSQLHRYILLNPKFKIDDTVFEIKYEEKKIIRYKSEEIVSLYIGGHIVDHKEEESGSHCNIA